MSYMLTPHIKLVLLSSLPKDMGKDTEFSLYSSVVTFIISVRVRHDFQSFQENWGACWWTKVHASAALFQRGKILCIQVILKQVRFFFKGVPHRVLGFLQTRNPDQKAGSSEGVTSLSWILCLPKGFGLKSAKTCDRNKNWKEVTERNPHTLSWSGAILLCSAKFLIPLLNSKKKIKFLFCFCSFFSLTIQLSVCSLTVLWK